MAFIFIIYDQNTITFTKKVNSHTYILKSYNTATPAVKIKFTLSVYLPDGQ